MPSTKRMVSGPSSPMAVGQRQALPEMTEPQAMTCDSANVIWVTGGFSTIVHSADAGASWETWSLDEDLYLTTIQFLDQQHGVVSGEFGTVLLSADGGVTWNRASDLPDSFYPQSAYFTSPAKGMGGRPQRDHLENREWRSGLATYAKRDQCALVWHLRFRQYTGRSRRQRDNSASKRLVMNHGPHSKVLPSLVPICVASPAWATVNS